MTTPDLINILTVIVLIGCAIALVFLIMLLFRANRAISVIENFGDNFSTFVRDLVSSLVSVGTVAAAVHKLVEHFVEGGSKNESKGGKKK